MWKGGNSCQCKTLKIEKITFCEQNITLTWVFRKKLGYFVWFSVFRAEKANIGIFQYIFDNKHTLGRVTLIV